MVENNKAQGTYFQHRHHLRLPDCHVLPSVDNNGTDGESVCTPVDLFGITPDVITCKCNHNSTFSVAEWFGCFAKVLYFTRGS